MFLVWAKRQILGRLAGMGMDSDPVCLVDAQTLVASLAR